MIHMHTTIDSSDYWLLDPTDPYSFLCVHDCIRLGLLIWKDLPVHLMPQQSRGGWYRQLVASPQYLRNYLEQDLRREFWRRSLMLRGSYKTMGEDLKLTQDLMRGLPRAKAAWYEILRKAWCDPYEASSTQGFVSTFSATFASNSDTDAWPFPVVVLGDQLFGGVDRLLHAEEYYVAMEGASQPGGRRMSMKGAI